jgi:hypothetical protein
MNRRRTLATLGIALVPLLFVFTGGWTTNSNGWGADSTNVASSSNPLQSAQDQLAVCQAALTARNPRMSVAARDWANRCIEVQSAAIRVLSATPTPTPTGSGTPTPSSSPSATPTQTTASPTPTPTTTSPSPSPTVTSPSPSPTATSPTPTPTPTPAGFPGPNNTGPGTATLLPWNGCPANGSPAAITTPNLHLNQVIINCNVRILTTGVVITFSKVNGWLYDEENSATRSFTINDSEIDGGIDHNAAVWHTNLTALRDNIHGGITGVSCVDTCHVEDSWLHGQRHDPNAKGQHYGGFLSNGGGDVNHQSLIKHNTIVCDVPQVDPGTGENDISSCSGDVNLFGDFGGVHYYTFDNNFLGAGTQQGHPSLCAYGGNSGVTAGLKQPADHIAYINNVFERGPFGTCGFFGPVGDIDMTRPGMVWTNNRYEDGAMINP